MVGSKPFTHFGAKILEPHHRSFPLRFLACIDSFHLQTFRFGVAEQRQEEPRGRLHVPLHPNHPDALVKVSLCTVKHPPITA